MQFSIALENQEELRLHVTAWAERVVVLPKKCCNGCVESSSVRLSIILGLFHWLRQGLLMALVYFYLHTDFFVAGGMLWGSELQF